MKKTFIVIAIVLAVSLSIGGLSFGQTKEKIKTLTYFFSDGCRECAITRQDVMPRIEKRFAGIVKFEYKSIDDAENYKLLFSLKQEYAADERSAFPVLYLNGNFIDGRDEKNLTYEALSRFITNALTGAWAEVKIASTGNIVGYLKGAGLFALLSAGFMDGINPCCFTVIVFFMSYLFLQGYRKRNIAITGLTFIFTVFVTYLFIGIGLFSSLYAIKGFWNLITIINISIGILSIALGITSLYDAFRFWRTGNAESMVLQLPRYMKNRIHSIVGGHYRIDRESAVSTNALKLAVNAVTAGFLISVFESICTGQLYLPTIAYIIKASSYKMMAFSYLLLYNIAFIAPLIIIFGFTMFGVTSQGFSAFLKKNMLIIKVLLALLFISFGVILAHADTVSTEERERLKRQDPYFWDFGRAKEGAILKHTFSIRNNSGNPMKIKQVNTSCGCTTVGIKRGIIPPGESGDIEVEFNTKGYPGEKSRYIFVHTDASRNPTIFLQIRAEIIGKRPEILK